jgi:hypothetical protein
MDAESRQGLDAIDRAVEAVALQRKAGWPPLSAAYLSAVEAVERLPQNQAGSDKSWVWRADLSDRQHFARAQRLP